jgi:hypothetical protein
MRSNVRGGLHRSGLMYDTRAVAAPSHSWKQIKNIPTWSDGGRLDLEENTDHWPRLKFVQGHGTY